MSEDRRWLWNPTADNLPESLPHGLRAALSFEERLALLVEGQFTWRENRALEDRLRNGKLKQKATIEDIKYQHPRGK